MIHAYSTDSPERRLVPFLLAVAAVIASYQLAKLLKLWAISPPWYLGLPTDTMALYGIFYWLFDVHLWRLPMFRWIGLVRVPNLSGRWSGIVRSSHDRTVEVPIEVNVRQSWTQIRIVGTTEGSRSESLSASIVVADEITLGYEYRNEPSALAARSMNPHRGVTRVLLSDTGDRLEGEYYSGRGRQNVGEIVLARELPR